MRAAIAILLFFWVIKSSAQDSTASRKLQLGYTAIEREDRLINPVFIIKGEDIRRFPTLNFLEAVNGLFPWVFSFEPRANDFLYVVDGNILADINALSLYNIDEVAFIRGGLDAGNFPFAKRGSFIIRTKSSSGTSSFEFNANTGFVYLRSGGPFSYVNSAFKTYDSARSKGLQQNYQLSYAGKMGNASYYLSGNFAQDQTPPVFLREFGLTDSTNFNFKQRNNVARFHISATIPVMPSLLFSFHGLAHMQRAKIFSSYSYTQANILTTDNTVLPEWYHTVSSSLVWKINKSFFQKIGFTYGNNNEQSETGSSSSSNLPGLYTGSISDTSKVERGYLESNTSFQSAAGRRWQVKAGLLLRYNFLNARKGHLRLSYINDQLNSIEAGNFRAGMKIITALPYITVEYTKLLSFYGGIQVLVKDIGIQDNWEAKNSSKRLPYGGAVFSAMNLFSEKKVINRLDLGINYSVRNNNLTDYYRLEKQETPGQLSLFLVYYPYTRNDFLKDKLLSLQVTAGFSEDRFMIGTEWFNGKANRFFALNVATVPVPSVVYLLGDEETKGISIFGKAQVLESENYSWNIRFNAVKEKRKNPYDVRQAGLYYPITAGLQNNISIADFFVQLTAMMGLNKEIPAVPLGSPGSKKVDDLSISHLLFGYKLPLNKKWISGMQVLAQAKNIIASKNKDSYREWPRYIGIGFNLAF